MQVRLKVIGGKNNGREINIAVPEFIIGRGEEAHLRPSSDLVSRKHCAIKIGDGAVTVEDMGSRNGTFVNGKQLSEVHTVQVGDTLRVGRLQFELVLDHAKPGNKRPKVGNVVEAAARAKAKPSSIEDSITDWLNEEPADSRATYKTVEFNLEETMANSREQAERRAEEESNLEDSVSGTDSDTIDTQDDKKKKKEKKETGKLPPVPKFSHQSSTNAADDVLRKFFNRR